MPMRVKLLCLLLVVMLMNLTVTFAQEVTPAAEATTASETADTAAPSDDTAAETTSPAEEAEVSDAEVRGLPLGVLLLGAVAVLSIGTIMLVRENPRPLDEEV